MKKKLEIIFGVFLILINYEAKADLQSKVNCKGYTAATEKQQERIRYVVSHTCLEEADCKMYLGLNANSVWNSCMTIDEAVILQDYNQPEESYRHWSLLYNLPLMEGLFNRFPKVTTKVYRASALLENEKEMIAKLGIGSVYVLPRFVSTSTDSMKTYAGDRIAMVINAKSARDVSQFNKEEDQKEHILLGGTKLRVDKVTVEPVSSYDGKDLPNVKVMVYEMTEI
ncbi:MAG: hypothetical protein ACOYL6_16175 [Bacteriovoracaceae bacterium]